MSKDIVICMDGTWSNPSEKTNVFKLFQSLKANGTQFVGPSAATGGYAFRDADNLSAFYLEGVGTSGWEDKMLGGVMGVGLHARVLHAFILASAAYEPGDDIWIFGFSRGAWSARSLAGMIARVGLMTPEETRDEEAGLIANKLWLLNKQTRGGDRGDRFWDGVAETPIKLVGVWDTVGSLGVPFFNGIKPIDLIEKHAMDFADLDLSPRVRHGRHALAIDEHREDFTPTLWNPRDKVLQVWFSGGHSDVGGGYPDAGLSDIALQWMAEEIKEIDKQFPFDLSKLDPNPAPNFKQHRHDEAQKLIWQIRTKPREIPDDAELHPSVFERLQAIRSYRPSVLKKLKKLAYIGDWSTAGHADDVFPVEEPAPSEELKKDESKTLAVHAAYCWNSAGLQVKAGQRYRVVAKGEWWDAHYNSTADGYESPSVLLKMAEDARRCKDARWFRLIAAVHPSPVLESKNPHNVVSGVLQSLIKSVSGIDDESDLTAIGANGDIEVKRDGFLYLFANDAAWAYSNNHGELTVTVQRVA
jgi:uncharacterized protein (DUF2235 family)